MFALGKLTIREVVSRVIYDPFFDGADVDVYFVHSGYVWVVPFNFLEFREDGFFFKGSFYPLYKIQAIWDNFSGRFLLKRRDVSGARRVFDFDFYDFPINLGAVYGGLHLLRHLPIIVDFLNRKFGETLDDSWLESFSGIETVNYDSISLKVVLNGALSGLAAIFIEGDFFKIAPLFPSFIDKSDFSSLRGAQKIVLGDFDLDSLVTCVFGKEFFCVSKDLHFIPVSEVGLERRLQVQLLNKILYIDSSRGCVVGVRDLYSMQSLTPRFEYSFLSKIGLRSCFELENFYRKEDAYWLMERGKIRVSDWDQLFLIP